MNVGYFSMFLGLSPPVCIYLHRSACFNFQKALGWARIALEQSLEENFLFSEN